MSLLLRFNFEAPGPYLDSTHVSWKTFKQDSTVPIQEGLLHYQKKSDYGTFDDLEKLPPILDKDIQVQIVQKEDCKSPTHIRHIVWQLIQHWKKINPQLILGMSGGWAVWSHFLHRMIHDDFARRKTEYLGTVVDMETVGRFSEIQ